MSDAEDEDDEEEEKDPLVAPTEDIAAAPSESADPTEIVRQKIPADIFEKFEIFSYRNAAVILSETRKAEFDEILTALRDFTITTDMVRRAGGNESDIPKLLTAALRPLGWHETVVQGDLLVRLLWRKQTGVTKKGKAIFEKQYRELLREKFLDGHKIDYVKNRVAFDLEWNSKDQTFDRDLYAFNAFSSIASMPVAMADVPFLQSGSVQPAFLIGKPHETNERSGGSDQGRTGEAVSDNPCGSAMAVSKPHGKDGARASSAKPIRHHDA
jgi:hypothetical protein